MKLDDYIINRGWVLAPFRRVHPNIITITGMICNILIITFLLQKYIYIANILLIIGAVAVVHPIVGEKHLFQKPDTSFSFVHKLTSGIASFIEIALFPFLTSGSIRV